VRRVVVVGVVEEGGEEEGEGEGGRGRRRVGGLRM
jgi:hypothetical protein